MFKAHQTRAVTVRMASGARAKILQRIVYDTEAGMEKVVTDGHERSTSRTESLMPKSMFVSPPKPADSKRVTHRRTSEYAKQAMAKAAAEAAVKTPATAVAVKK